MQFLVHLHSGLRYIALILLLVAIVKAWGAWKGQKPFTGGSKKLYLFAMVSLHLQLVIGLVLYFVGPRVQTYLAAGDVMGNGTARFFVIEHISVMIIGIALVTVGYSRGKRLSEDVKKHKSVAVWYLIGTLLILSRIPWPFMKNLGVAWF